MSSPYISPLALSPGASSRASSRQSGRTLQPASNRSSRSYALNMTSGSPKSSRPSSRSSSVDSRSFLGLQEAGGPILDGNIRVLNSIDCGNQIFSLRYTEDGGEVCVGLMDGSIKIINPASANQSLSILANHDTIKESLPVTCIRTKPGLEFKNIIGASYASGHLRVWNLENCGLQFSVQEPEEILCLSFNPIINIVGVGKGNGEIKLYDHESGKLASILTKSKNPNMTDGHKNKVFCIVNHPANPQEFISGGWDGEIHVWDARCPHSIRRIQGPFIAGEGLDMDRKGREILAGSWRGEHQLLQIDYSSGAIIADIEPERQNSYISCTQYLGKDHAMTGGTDISMFRVIDLKKRKTMASIRNLGPGIISLDCQKRGTISKIAVNTDTHINILEFTK